MGPGSRCWAGLDIYFQNMRTILLSIAVSAFAQTPAGGLWAELANKRTALPSLHQEFEVPQMLKTANGSQGSKRQIVLDMAGERWRGRVCLDQAKGERARTATGAYRANDQEWTKTKEMEWRP